MVGYHDMELNKEYRIPRVIHYFWFGGGEKPQSVKKCIESWKQNCPDFEIREWNESNYDVHKHSYMEKAYDEGLWAFVSDYARLDVLYRFGGIYLDTDVEVLKDLSPLCETTAFIGFESPERVNDGQGIGCMPGMPIIKEMLDVYDYEGAYECSLGRNGFIESPKLRTKVLMEHGLVQNGSRQRICGMDIFPVDYLCPLDYDTGKLRITNNTYSIHHFNASWKDERAKRYLELLRKLNRVYGKKIGKKLFGVIMVAKDAFKKMIRRCT